MATLWYSSDCYLYQEDTSPYTGDGNEDAQCFLKTTNTEEDEAVETNADASCEKTYSLVRDA